MYSVSAEGFLAPVIPEQPGRPSPAASRPSRAAAAATAADDGKPCSPLGAATSTGSNESSGDGGTATRVALGGDEGEGSEGSGAGVNAAQPRPFAVFDSACGSPVSARLVAADAVVPAAVGEEAAAAAAAAVSPAAAVAAGSLGTGSTAEMPAAAATVCAQSRSAGSRIKAPAHFRTSSSSSSSLGGAGGGSRGSTNGKGAASLRTSGLPRPSPSCLNPGKLAQSSTALLSSSTATMMSSRPSPTAPATVTRAEYTLAAIPSPSPPSRVREAAEADSPSETPPARTPSGGIASPPSLWTPPSPVSFTPRSTTTTSRYFGSRSTAAAAAATPSYYSTSSGTPGAGDNNDGRIKIACRVKPRLDGDGRGRAGRAVSSSPLSPVCVSVGFDEKTVAWAGERADGVGAKHFTFDYAAGETVGQEELFEKIGRPVTNACLEGFNGTIFCYGQTGSGKTFTTFGPPDDGESGGGKDEDGPDPSSPEGDRSDEPSPPGEKDGPSPGGEVNGSSPEGNRTVPSSSGSKRKKKTRMTDGEGPGAGGGGITTGEDRGLVPRVLEYLFDRFSTSAGDGGSQFCQQPGGEGTSPSPVGTGPSEIHVCRCSFYEIYNEQVYDLAAPDGKREALNIREAADKGIFLEGLSEEEVTNAQEACDFLMRGYASRHTASTAMNSSSSRSHAVFTLVIDTAVQMDQADENGQTDSRMATPVRESPGSRPRANRASGTGHVRVRSARFNLVDLAGSERQSRTQAKGAQLKDASSINKSLSALGRVINSLVEGSGAGHVPYRDSKLTRLMAHSLGGNSKTVLVATVSASVPNSGETLSTLKFVQRAKLIKNRVVRNEATHGGSLALALRQENEGLRKLVADQGHFLSKVKSQLREADSLQARLSMEVVALRLEARKHRDTALEATELLSERQAKLEELEQALKSKEFELAKAIAASPRRKKGPRWSSPGPGAGESVREMSAGTGTNSVADDAVSRDMLSDSMPSFAAGTESETIVGVGGQAQGRERRRTPLSSASIARRRNRRRSMGDEPRHGATAGVALTSGTDGTPWDGTRRDGTGWDGTGWDDSRSKEYGGVMPDLNWPDSGLSGGGGRGSRGFRFQALPPSPASPILAARTGGGRGVDGGEHEYANSRAIGTVNVEAAEEKLEVVNDYAEEEEEEDGETEESSKEELASQPMVSHPTMLQASAAAACAGAKPIDSGDRASAKPAVAGRKDDRTPRELQQHQERRRSPAPAPRLSAFNVEGVVVASSRAPSLSTQTTPSTVADEHEDEYEGEGRRTFVGAAENGGGGGGGGDGDGDTSGDDDDDEGSSLDGEVVAGVNPMFRGGRDRVGSPLTSEGIAAALAAATAVVLPADRRQAWAKATRAASSGSESGTGRRSSPPELSAAAVALIRAGPAAETPFLGGSASGVGGSSGAAECPADEGGQAVFNSVFLPGTARSGADETEARARKASAGVAGVNGDGGNGTDCAASSETASTATVSSPEVTASKVLGTSMIWRPGAIPSSGVVGASGVGTGRTMPIGRSLFPGGSVNDVDKGSDAAVSRESAGLSTGLSTGLSEDPTAAAAKAAAAPVWGHRNVAPPVEEGGPTNGNGKKPGSEIRRPSALDPIERVSSPADGPRRLSGDVAGGEGLNQSAVALLASVVAMLRDQSDARDAMAEPCLRRSLEIHEQLLGPDHPEVATDLSNLAEVLQDNGEIEHAEPLHRRALEIRLRSLGPDHKDVAFSLHNLALVYRSRGNIDEAKRYVSKANEIWEKAYEIPPTRDGTAAASGGDVAGATTTAAADASALPQAAALTLQLSERSGSRSVSVLPSPARLADLMESIFSPRVFVTTPRRVGRNRPRCAPCENSGCSQS